MPQDEYTITGIQERVECAFEILASKWGIVYRTIDVNITFCESIYECSL